MSLDAAPVGAPAWSAIASASTQTATVAEDRDRAIELQQSDAASVQRLLASIVAHAVTAFSDKTTIVGALSSAQTEFASDAMEPSYTSRGSKDAHEATSSFAYTVAKVALPHSADFPTTTVTNAVAIYASDLGKKAA